MIPLLLALGSTVASNQASEDEKKQQRKEGNEAYEYNFNKEQFEKRAEGDRIEKQKRQAIARAIGASSNELPEGLNTRMYAPYKQKELSPSNWRTAAGVLNALQGVNWNNIGNSSAPQAASDFASV